jgi:hypothetical protein
VGPLAADILAEGDEYPETRKRAVQDGYRTVLAAPLVHAGEAIGAIFIRRTEVRTGRGNLPMVRDEA